MADDIPPDWAWERAYRLSYGDQQRFDDPKTSFRISRQAQAFARYIAEHEEPPVDPLLVEAREIVATDSTERTANQTAAIRGGRACQNTVDIALRALKRGMELAK